MGSDCAGNRVREFDVGNDLSAQRRMLSQRLLLFFRESFLLAKDVFGDCQITDVVK
jgi:hypothetical protein